MRGLIILDFNRTLYNPDNNSLFDGVIEFLKDYSKTYSLAIIGKGDEKRSSLIDALNIKKYFEYIDLKEEKEDNMFKQCMQTLKFNPEQCWSIGDRIKKEIKMSKKFGIKTIWFKNGKFSLELPESKEEEPDFTVSDFKEIRNIIPLH